MAGLKEYLVTDSGTAAKGVAGKNTAAKRRIVARLAVGGDTSLAELAKELDISIPTATKLVAELIAEGVVADRGKAETGGGRRPNVFALAAPDSTINFLGIEIGTKDTRLIITDLHNAVIGHYTAPRRPGDMKSVFAAVEGMMTRLKLEKGISRDRFMGAGVCVPHLANITDTAGYDSPEHLGEAMRERIGMPVLVDSTARARCVFERRNSDAAAARDMLYVDLGHSVSAAVVVGGALYYGHGGLAGESGDEPLFDRDVDINALVEAARRRDTAAMELMEAAAAQAGRAVAAMLGVLNPELVVAGGALAGAGDYMMLTLQAAANRHSTERVYKDTRFRLSTADENAGAAGAAIMIRDKTVGL